MLLNWTSRSQTSWSQEADEEYWRLSSVGAASSIFRKGGFRSMAVTTSKRKIQKWQPALAIIQPCLPHCCQRQRPPSLAKCRRVGFLDFLWSIDINVQSLKLCTNSRFCQQTDRRYSGFFRSSDDLQARQKSPIYPLGRMRFLCKSNWQKNSFVGCVKSCLTNFSLRNTQKIYS